MFVSYLGEFMWRYAHRDRDLFLEFVNIFLYFIKFKMIPFLMIFDVFLLEICL